MIRGSLKPTGCATRCIMGRSPEARNRARGDQRSCGFRREDFFLAKYHTVSYTLRESRTQAQRRRERAIALITMRRWLQERLALLEVATGASGAIQFRHTLHYRSVGLPS